MWNERKRKFRDDSKLSDPNNWMLVPFLEMGTVKGKNQGWVVKSSIVNLIDVATQRCWVLLDRWVCVLEECSMLEVNICAIWVYMVSKARGLDELTNGVCVYGEEQRKKDWTLRECQLSKSGRRGSSHGDYEGAASVPWVKSGNDDVLMAKRGLGDVSTMKVWSVMTSAIEKPGRMRTEKCLLDTW